MPELSRKLEALILDILPTFILNENQSIYSLNWDFIVVPIWCFKKIGFILISYFCFKFCTMKILFTAILSILTYSIFAQTAGSLDPSFGTAGKVQLDLGGIDSKAYAVSIQTDGYILVSGYSTSAIYGKDFTIVRLDADGNLDLNFSWVETLGELNYVGGNLHALQTELVNLGNLKKVGGNFSLRHSNVTSLENLEFVGGDLQVTFSPIESFGKLKSVGGDLFLLNIPLVENLSIEEIREMVNVTGEIIFQ